MSCGSCSEKTKAGAALATGGPVAMGGARTIQRCPDCGWSMPKSGACKNPQCRQQTFLSYVESWLRDTSEDYDDWEWDGKKLTVLCGESVEHYTLEDIGYPGAKAARSRAVHAKAAPSTRKRRRGGQGYRAR